MPKLRVHCFVLVACVAVVGVTDGCSSSTVRGNDGTGGVRIDPRFSFSAYEAQRACGRDDDCVVLPTLTNCQSCCGHQAVSRGEVERAYAAVIDACKQPGAPAGGECTGYCRTPTGFACFEGMCVLVPNADAGLSVVPECTIGPAAPDGGTRAPDPGPAPACGARMVQTGFEDGLDPSWQAIDPTAFRIDRDEPLAGAASLRISYRQKDAYLIIEQPDACAIRLAFTLRTRLIAHGLTLARIVAGTGSWFHLRLDSCKLSIAEETSSPTAGGIGFGGESWAVPDDRPVRVVVTVDLRAKTLSSAVGPLGAPLPAAQSRTINGDPSGTGAIRAIELGSAPGVQATAVGAVWLDDLVID